MTDRQIEKIVNRFKEASGKSFDKIPQSLIAAQRIVALLRDEIAEAKTKPERDSFEIQLLEARLIAALRVQTAEEIKAKLRK